MKSLFILLFTSMVSSGHNVLFIYVDDMGPVPDWVMTPNMDRLAAKGVTFDRMSCNNPFCGPSRSGMLSGLMPWTLGITDGWSGNATLRDVLPTRRMLPQYFRQHGYRTHRFGKFEHFKDYTLWDVWKDQGNDRTLTNLEESWTLAGRGVSGDSSVKVFNCSPEDFEDSYARRGAIASLETLADGSIPWFLGFGCYLPHQPLVIPKQFSVLYDPAEIPLPVEPPLTTPGPGYHGWPFYEAWYDNGGALVTESDRRKYLAAYGAAISFVDWQIGKVLDKMDELGLWDSTIVVLLSDNGVSTGEHGFAWSKQNSTNENLSTPCIISVPGGAQGQHSLGMVSHVDMFPTLVELAGLPPFVDLIPLEGRSFAPLLTNPMQPWDYPTYFVKTKIVASIATVGVMKGSKKLVRFQSNSGVYFWHRRIDMASDPLEFVQQPTSGFEELQSLLADQPGALDGRYYRRPSVNKVPGWFADRDNDGVSDEQELAHGQIPYKATRGLADVIDYYERPEPTEVDVVWGNPTFSVTNGISTYETNVSLWESNDLTNWTRAPNPTISPRTLTWTGSKNFFRLQIGTISESRNPPTEQEKPSITSETKEWTRW